MNMLNVKYIIVPTKEGPQAQENPEAFGNAWFVENINWVENSNEEILSLGESDLASTAVINTEFKDQISSTLILILQHKLN